MAAFLFFLSVALVVTNQQDIRYTLFADDKQKCDAAADGMLNYALQVMRANSNWEARLQTERPPFASGVTANIKWRPYLLNLSSTNSRYSMPTSPSRESTALELTATAQAGVFRSEVHAVVEEFRLADSLAIGSAKPHLFCNETAFKVLGPAFRWDALNAMSTTAINGTIDAGGGELYSCLDKDGTDPTEPPLKDYVPNWYVSGTQSAALPKDPPNDFIKTGEQFQRGQRIQVLRLKDNQFIWEPQEDPNLTLRHVDEAATYNRDANFPSDVVHDTVQVSDPALKSSDPGYFNGTKAEWFTINGRSARADKDAYYVFATHFFYSGNRFKTVNVPGGVTSEVKRAKMYQPVCVLKFANNKWTDVVDPLKVTDMKLEPSYVDGPVPDINYMLVHNGVVYAKEAGQTETNDWLVGSANGWTRGGIKGSKYAFFMGDTVVDFVVGAPTPPFPAPSIRLTTNDIAASFPAFLPPRNLDNTTGNVTEGKMYFNWRPVRSSFTSVNSDAYGVVQVDVSEEQGNGSPHVYDPITALMHFNGKSWQVLPAGVGLLLPTKSAYRNELNYGYKGGLGPVTAGSRLALAGYPSSQALLRRYVVVARWSSQ